MVARALSIATKLYFDLAVIFITVWRSLHLSSNQSQGGGGGAAAEANEEKNTKAIEAAEEYLEEAMMLLGESQKQQQEQQVRGSSGGGIFNTEVTHLLLEAASAVEAALTSLAKLPTGVTAAAELYIVGAVYVVTYDKAPCFIDVQAITSGGSATFTQCSL